MPLTSDKYISSAIFEAVHNAVLGAAVWGYLHRLLQVYAEISDDQPSSAIILQEISNVCYSELDRVRKLFKRYVQMCTGAKYFKRVSGAYDNGVARVTMKVKPETLMRDNPHLYFILSLCRPEADVNRVTDRVKKLNDISQTRPMDMNDSEFDSFCDLAVAASFIQAFPKKGQTYISKSKALHDEIDTLKANIDLSSFAVPIDNLLEPGMAVGALDSLNRFIIDKAGSSLGFLYQDLGDDCLLENGKEMFVSAPAPSTVKSPSQAPVVEQRREKNKTRPPHSSIYTIDPNETRSLQPEAKARSPPLKVKPSIIEVFSTIFSRSQARGSLSWTAFRSAMTALKFSVKPGAGSANSFFPPEGFGVRKSFTVHQPHQSQIEGYRLLYGWGMDSFEQES
ncbi:hypothetical protein AJ79_01090 [Helicocarpus griseus UAMH5409]|uniref:Uncharacterized protein n=1 Tax=Helicocarpus griseus UAMH5409 TaxID=1447875 RepID=A0A2B7Y8G4_9EURO|nr:hypothetical protein AJ79_01090 [Helicocarpus griseus UAMH5409]